MFRLALFLSLFVSACAADPNPCAQGCISAFVEYEEDFVLSVNRLVR